MKNSAHYLQSIIKSNGGQGGIMTEPLLIANDRVLMIVHNLETMREIFTDKQLLFSELQRQRFFEARNTIHKILSEGMEERRGYEHK
jgi:hypothetical protein